ncbi:MAG: hypothetical protein HeimC2_00190 [Candidatus Heimdallarchaeota archaeon LC_2]|nr:MAG: hypothetical protein HeimC2_00190 [Candidatus Heimdallarchaeota archaeon LC_2]
MEKQFEPYPDVLNRCSRVFDFLPLSFWNKSDKNFIGVSVRNITTYLSLMVLYWVVEGGVRVYFDRFDTRDFFANMLFWMGLVLYAIFAQDIYMRNLNTKFLDLVTNNLKTEGIRMPIKEYRKNLLIGYSKNYSKRPLFWLSFILLLIGAFLSQYQTILFLFDKGNLSQNDSIFEDIQAMRWWYLVLVWIFTIFNSLIFAEVFTTIISSTILIYKIARDKRIRVIDPASFDTFGGFRSIISLPMWGSAILVMWVTISVLLLKLESPIIEIRGLEYGAMPTVFAIGIILFIFPTWSLVSKLGKNKDRYKQKINQKILEVQEEIRELENRLGKKKDVEIEKDILDKKEELKELLSIINVVIKKEIRIISLIKQELKPIAIFLLSGFSRNLIDLVLEI